MDCLGGGILVDPVFTLLWHIVHSLLGITLNARRTGTAPCDRMPELRRMPRTAVLVAVIALMFRG